MQADAPSTAASLRSPPSRAGAARASAGELHALHRYPRRLMLVCGAVLSLLSISVLFTLVVVQVNSYEARRIAEFRRAHNALQNQLARQDASYARLANLTGYAWGRNVQFGEVSGEALRKAYLAGGQRLIVVADDDSRPQMALGLATESWGADKLRRYLQLSTAVSLIQRLMATHSDGEPAGASYFFDPSGQYLSLDKGLTERSLLDALGATSRGELFEHLRAPAQLSTPASSHDQVPLLESVVHRDQPRRGFARHPITGEPALASVFGASDGATPIATFVAYEPISRLQTLLRRNSQGHIALLDGDGLRVLASHEPSMEYAGRHVDRDWVLLGDATRARYHGGRYTLALAVEGTPWTLVESYSWTDILHGIAPFLTAGSALVLAALTALWCLLLWLHRRMYIPALRQVESTYARDRRLQQLLEHLPIGMALLDAKTGVIKDLNGPLRRMDLVTGARLIPLLRETSLRAELDNGVATSVSELPSVQDARQMLAHRVQVRSGGLDWPGDLLLMVEEVTDDVRALRVESERAALADACNRAKSQFVAAMSHEIRTPLHGIIGHLELLSRAPLPAEEGERVRRLRQAADSLTDIINDVLDLSRIESGQWTLTPEQFMPAALLERVALLYAPLAQAKGVELDCLIDPDVPAAAVAPMVAIERVLRNLASNALKFTASGRVQLRAACARTGAQAWLRFEVTDSGIGLSADECERLFQPFVQADASILSRFGGSGLGLALCQQLCECMDGRIWVESTACVGSRFVFEVPLLTSITVRKAMPLLGRTVGLLAMAGPWKAELTRRLHSWGAQVTVLGAVAEAEVGLPVVVFEPAKGELQRLRRAGSVWVRVCRQGPLQPRWSEGRCTVSCYVSDALCQALLQIRPAGEPEMPVIDLIG